MTPLFADLHDLLRLHSLVPGAAFGIEELQKLLQSFGIRRVAEKCAFPLHHDQVFGSEFVEMVGEGGVGDCEFVLNFADYEALRVSREQQLHDAKPRFRAHGREHVGIFDRAIRSNLRHISIILEI